MYSLLFPHLLQVSDLLYRVSIRSNPHHGCRLTAQRLSCVLKGKSMIELSLEFPYYRFSQSADTNKNGLLLNQ